MEHLGAQLVLLDKIDEKVADVDQLGLGCLVKLGGGKEGFEANDFAELIKETFAIGQRDVGVVFEKMVEEFVRAFTLGRSGGVLGRREGGGHSD